MAALVIGEAGTAVQTSRYGDTRAHNIFERFRRIPQSTQRSFLIHNIAVMMPYAHELKGACPLGERYCAPALEPASSIGH